MTVQGYDASQYALNNVSVRQQTNFDTSGRPVLTEVYTFYVGKNGPFTRSFLIPPPDAATITAALNAEVQRIRLVMQNAG